jgi:hypothetical protein
LANANAKKDPIRREAYLLSTLQSIHQWRGSIVDHVISKQIIPDLNRGQLPSKPAVIRYAHTIFEQQRDFAVANRMREPGMTKKSAGDSFASLYPVEYGLGISQEEMDQAWCEVEQALKNLLSMQALLGQLLSGLKLIAQRPLTFTCHQVNVKMVPDLIVFYGHEAPLIIDWKVHTSSFHDTRLQLATYALALTECKPHKDFPTSLEYYTPEEIRLLEIQLLSAQQYSYLLTRSEIEAVESYISRTHMEMMLASDGDLQKLTMLDFPAASRPETCQRCPFRSLCWDRIDTI